MDYISRSPNCELEEQLACLRQDDSPEALRLTDDIRHELERRNWRHIYASGQQLNRYPFDAVVGFICKHGKPGDRVLEVGCGAGNNLWFAAREGYQVCGIDIIPEAIQYARDRFKEEGLLGRFYVAPMEILPFPDASFDLVIDRYATPYGDQKKAIAEIQRVLVPGGKVLISGPSDVSLPGWDVLYSKEIVEVRIVAQKWQ